VKATVGGDRQNRPGPLVLENERGSRRNSRGGAADVEGPAPGWRAAQVTEILFTSARGSDPLARRHDAGLVRPGGRASAR